MVAILFDNERRAVENSLIAKSQSSIKSALHSNICPKQHKDDKGTQKCGGKNVTAENRKEVFMRLHIASRIYQMYVGCGRGESVDRDEKQFWRSYPAPKYSNLLVIGIRCDLGLTEYIPHVRRTK